MEVLASLFVSLVTFTHALAPQTNIARVLDTPSSNSKQESVLAETDSVSTNSGEKSRDLGKQRLFEVKQTRRQQFEDLQTTRKKVAEERLESREEFKKRLTTLRDTKKQEIVSRIDENIAKLNDKWVDQLNKVLDRLSETLTKIKSRTETAKTQGKDVSGVETSIADAQKAIDTAQVAVNSQAEKIYTINITTDTGIGRDVKTTINSFHNDIKNTKESVDAAKKAVVETLRTLKVVLGETKDGE